MLIFVIILYIVWEIPGTIALNSPKQKRSRQSGESNCSRIIKNEKLHSPGGTPTKETGFFAECAGSKASFCKKPGFWGLSKSYKERT